MWLLRDTQRDASHRPVSLTTAEANHAVQAVMDVLAAYRCTQLWKTCQVNIVLVRSPTQGVVGFSLNCGFTIHPCLSDMRACLIFICLLAATFGSSVSKHFNQTFCYKYRAKATFITIPLYSYQVKGKAHVKHHTLRKASHRDKEKVKHKFAINCMGLKIKHNVLLCFLSSK